MYQQLFALLALLGLSGGAVGADDTDPVRAKLEKAKATFESDEARFQKAAHEYFDKREAAAREMGDKKLVDQVKEERQAFDEKAEMPKAATALIKQRAAARAALEFAYTLAIKEYTKAKKDDEAETVEKELAKFKRDDGLLAEAKLKRPALDSEKWKKKPSGLAVWEEKVGEGDPVKPGAKVKVHYIGWLTDAKETVFDSSFKHGVPAEFELNGVIQGWQEGLPGMKSGGVRFLKIPASLSYGDRGAGVIPPGATIVFRVELVK